MDNLWKTNVFGSQLLYFCKFIVGAEQIKNFIWQFYHNISADDSITNVEAFKVKCCDRTSNTNSCMFAWFLIHLRFDASGQVFAIECCLAVARRLARSSASWFYYMFLLQRSFVVVPCIVVQTKDLLDKELSIHIESWCMCVRLCVTLSLKATLATVLIWRVVFKVNMFDV